MPSSTSPQIADFSEWGGNSTKINCSEGREGQCQSQISSPDFSPGFFLSGFLGQSHPPSRTVHLPSWCLCFCGYCYFRPHCPDSTTCLNTSPALTCSVAFSDCSSFLWMWLIMAYVFHLCTVIISIPKNMLTNLGCSKTFSFPKPPESVQSWRCLIQLETPTSTPLPSECTLCQNGLLKLFLAEMQELV